MKILNQQLYALKPQNEKPHKRQNENKPKTPKRKLREIFVNFQMEVCKNEARAIGMAK